MISSTLTDRAITEATKEEKKSGHCHSRSLSSAFTNCIKAMLVKMMSQRKMEKKKTSEMEYTTLASN